MDITFKEFIDQQYIVFGKGDTLKSVNPNYLDFVDLKTLGLKHSTVLRQQTLICLLTTLSRRNALTLQSIDT